ncbi:MAG: DJ-1 family glyoxalase III [Bacteroides sp.]
MKKVNVFLQDRFETVEALAVIDVLRRAGIEVETVSLMDDLAVKSAQGITVMADKMYEDCDFSETDLYFLPGGPGTKGYESRPDFLELIKEAYSDGKWISAICAAPSILGHLGILQGKKATCFPGYEKDLYGAEFVDEKVVVDGNVITSRGMGTSIDLGLELVSILVSPDKAREIGKGVQYL